MEEEGEEEEEEEEEEESGRRTEHSARVDHGPYDARHRRLYERSSCICKQCMRTQPGSSNSFSGGGRCGGQKWQHTRDKCGCQTSELLKEKDVLLSALIRIIPISVSAAAAARGIRSCLRQCVVMQKRCASGDSGWRGRA